MTFQNFLFKNISQHIIKQMLKENSYSVAKPVMAFAGAGLVMTLSNPFDLVRIRMQTMSQLVEMGRLQKSYEGIVDCARRVTREEGIRAFWKGNAANLIRFYASQSFNFVSKQTIRSKLKTVIPHQNTHPIFLNVLSGVFGSWLALSILYPIEHTRNRLSNNTTCKNKGIINTMIKTAKTQGFKALYTGCTISIFGVAIFRGSYFGIFDTYKHNKNNMQKWALAYFSSLVAILLTYPSDTVRRRLICSQKRQLKYKGFWDCLQKIHRKQGIRTFYRGGPIIFLQSVGSSSILFLYDKLHNDLKRIYHQ